MSLEITAQIYEVQKSIDKLNASILMIAWKLHINSGNFSTKHFNEDYKDLLNWIKGNINED